METHVDSPSAGRWWEGDIPLPPADTPLLAPYDASRPGYEFLNARACEGGPDVSCFAREGDKLVVCLWNIWERAKDPAESDPEARALNRLQGTLGPLSDGVRYVRLQIACFERCFHTFPGNVDLILRGIAAGRADATQPVSCEPPWAWFRRILSQTKVASHVDDLRRDQLRRYLVACQWWLFGGHPDALPAVSRHVATRVYELLGPPAPLKHLYVSMVVASLLFWTTPSLLGHAPRWESLKAHLGILEGAIRSELAGQPDAISPLIHKHNDGGSCHHAFVRRLEHILAHIGAGRPVEFPDKGSERRRVQDAVTNYVHALGCWLNGVDADRAIAAWPASDETVGRLFRCLGAPTPLKRWLAGCLHKKLRENQARHGRGAIDAEPERFELSLRIREHE
jgi:hypothetical protein